MLSILRPLLFRLSPGSLVQEGLAWSNATAFNELYGRIETRITERSAGDGEDNRMSRGSKTTTKSVRPGVMPALFGRHLIDKAVFLNLNEVAGNLPTLEEECIPVRMDSELARAYRHDVEEPLGDSDQGDDETKGSTVAGHDAANAARLSRLSVWLECHRLPG